jgi:hypothetical protein
LDLGLSEAWRGYVVLTQFQESGFDLEGCHVCFTIEYKYSKKSLVNGKGFILDFESYDSLLWFYGVWVLIR